MIKQLLFTVLLLGTIAGCKNDKADPQAKIEGIVGRWKATEIENLKNGNKVWQTVNNSAWFISFHTDGSVADDNGNLICCAPNILTIDGLTIKIPAETDLPSQSCASTRCSGCMNWGIEQRGDEIIIAVCNSSRIKYARVR